MTSWVPAVSLTLLPHVGGILGGLITSKEVKTWYMTLVVPSWQPPNWIFALVWTVLYTSMGYGSYLIYRELGGLNEDSMVPLGLYSGQLVLNWAWSPIFFGAHKIGWGFVEILALTGAVAATTISWFPIHRTAAYLMFPYMAWQLFVSALCYCIWRDNKEKKE
ncbi:translocator protein-like [Rhinophrynus dorsalis]